MQRPVPDINAVGRPTADMDWALRIVRYKTAKYTLRPSTSCASEPPSPGLVLISPEGDECYALPVGESSICVMTCSESSEHQRLPASCFWWTCATAGTPSWSLWALCSAL